MLKWDSGAYALVTLDDGSNATDLILELDFANMQDVDRNEIAVKRFGYRNSNLLRLITSQFGEFRHAIAKLRLGSFFSLILDPWGRIDQELYAVIMETWIA